MTQASVSLCSNYSKKNYTTRQWHYISGGDSLTAVYIKTNETGQLYFIAKDHLGSILGLYNTSETLVEEYSYDAWGRRRDPVTLAPLTQTPKFLLTRGYTGHEHLDEFELINMNGRLYDPLLGRMLSPDNYVQDANGTQNYNRYSYCTNNPLTKIDPSGDIAWSVPFIVSASISGIGGIIEGSSRGLKGDALFRYSVNSSIYGGITGGFGALAGSGSYGISILNGDGVIKGAVNGSISGAVSGVAMGFLKSGDLDDAWSGLKSGGLNGAISGAISGGISAYKEGGNIWSGNLVTIGRNQFSLNNSLPPLNELYVIASDGNRYPLSQMQRNRSDIRNSNSQFCRHNGIYRRLQNELSHYPEVAPDNVTINIEPRNRLKGNILIVSDNYAFPDDGGIYFETNNGQNGFILWPGQSLNFSSRNLSSIYAQIYGTYLDNTLNAPFTFRIIVRLQKP